MAASNVRVAPPLAGSTMNACRPVAAIPGRARIEELVSERLPFGATPLTATFSSVYQESSELVRQKNLFLNAGLRAPANWGRFKLVWM